MNLILYIGIIAYIYLTTTVSAAIGIDKVGLTSVFLIVALALFKITRVDINNLISRYKIESCILLIALIAFVLKLIINDIDGLKGIIFFLVVPVLFLILLSSKSVVNKSSEFIRKIVLFFYLTECLLAIYERSFTINFFPYDALNEYVTIERLGFRSTAFLGHPLANALCVSTIMGFILASEMKLIFKLSFIVLGFVALLCFNAKGAILIWLILMSIYFVKFGLSKNRKELLSYPVIIFIIVSVYTIYTLIVRQGFGDRFFQGLLFDGSAMARVEVFRSFSYINTHDFWLGNSKNYILVMSKLGAGGVENSYIVIALNYGIVIASLLIVVYVFWIKHLLMRFAPFDKLIIISSFILVGSTNNSLAGSTSWMFFILCISTFSRPVRYLLPRVSSRFENYSG